MLASFLIVFPIFSVIALGWGAARTNVLRPETGTGVADYVFVVAIPLMLFRTLATAPLPSSPPWAYWLAYFIPLAIVWTAAALISQKGFNRGQQEGAIIGFTAAQSNMVLLGISLVLQIFGDAGSVPLFLLVGVHLPITLTVATILIEQPDEGQSKARTILTRLARNPIIMAIIAGGLFRLSGVALPAPLLSILKFIGDSAAPCALFATGMALSRHSIGDDKPLLIIVTTLKLLIHPVLVFLLARFVFQLPPVWVGVATVLAGCPCGVNSYLLAERYRVAMGLASGAVSLTTLCAIFTTTFLVWLVL